MRRLVAAAYVVGILVVTVQRGLLAFANDFAIFRAATWNLVGGVDLYVYRPEQALDLFKYSPAFALLFAPFAVLPFAIGLALWNLTGAVLLMVALRQLLPAREALVAQSLVYLAVLRNAQSAQSNSLVAALIILSFVALELEQRWKAAACIAAGAAIKVFPLVAALLAWTRPNRRRFAATLALVGVCFVLLPLLVTDTTTLLHQYQSWWALHAVQSGDAGQNAMSVLRAAVGVSHPPWMVQLAGAAMLVLPLLVGRHAFADDRRLRMQLLSSVLLFGVLFNHKAEAQSYVIAMAGVAVWWGSAPAQSWRLAVAALVVVCTNLPSADFVPAVLKTAITPVWRGPIPCTLFWLMLQGELLLGVWRHRSGRAAAKRYELDRSLPKSAAAPA